jgi:alpha-L-rhamnosidase
MKIKVHLFCLLLSFPIFFSACGQKGDILVSDLRCEYLTDPLGIDVEKPRFSWKLFDADHTRGLHQTAYRIMVASAPGKLESGNADVWDSGTVASGQSHLVPYGGPKLQSGADCYWKVIVSTSLSTEGTSPTARFSMGLLSRSDWKGEWINHPAASPEKHIWFRKKMTLNDRASTAFVHIASAGYHELYVNGRKVDERVLAPAITRLDKRVMYVTYDIASLLKKGDNTVALWYAPGWSRYKFFAPAVNQAVLLQLNGKTEKGDAFTLHTDNSWKCAESYSRNTGAFQIVDMGGEEVDGRRYSTDWNTPGFDDSQWLPAGVTTPLKDGGEPAFSAQMTDPSRIIETVQAQSVTDTIPGLWRVDMGKNFTGFLEAHFDGLQAGDTVIIQISDRDDSVNEFNQKQYYIARGEDGEAFSNHFNYFGGRYIHFSGLRHAPKLSDVTGQVVSSAGKRTGYFECSDELFNRIYNMDMRTYELCTVEGITVDCPHRERLGYGAEGGYLTTWGLGLPCFSTGAFYVKNVRDWSDVQMPDGRIYNTAPQINDMWGGPLYSSAIMNIAWEHYQAYGDKAILEKAFEVGKKWLEFLHPYVSDGLLAPYASGGHYLGDWLAPGPRREMGGSAPSDFFNNCVYAMNLDLFIRMAETLERGNEVGIYRERLETARTKTHETWFDPAMNSYLNGDQVRTSFALFAGIVPEHLRPAVLEHLENDMRHGHPWFDFGSTSRYQYFKILLANPHFHEIVSDILSKTTYPGYGYFLSIGETAWPEVWEKGHPSRIHTTYTGISAWFIKGLAGIEPDAEDPGYHTVSIRPNVIEKLAYAKAGLESPYGLIESGWKKREDGKIVFNISVPSGSKACIYLPANAAGITENGKSLSQSAGILRVSEENGSVCVYAESGRYVFVVEKNAQEL